MADEYIRKQDALDAFGLSEKTRKYGGDHSGYDTRMLYEIQDTIENLEPADVVSVVRCRDCKHHKDGNFAWSNFAPYTEPDMEQVRKEAYEQGRKVGIKDGMCEAWETAKKVTYVSKYGGYGDCLDKVFDRHDGDAWDVFDYSPTEVIEKIRAYEQEKEMDGLRQNIQTIVDECGYSLDEIAEVLQKMKKS